LLPGFTDYQAKEEFIIYAFQVQKV